MMKLKFSLINNRLVLFLLTAIFLVALAIRFFYFPENVYFGYDQARDAYVSNSILSGHLKILGPPASYNSKLFHGPLAYYIFAPFYFLSKGDPTLVSIFLRVYNAGGVFLIFAVAASLFNKKIGLISSMLYAFSYEQTQYALFLSHPSLAVLTVLVFYLGIIKLVFLKNQKGLILALAGLGLSIQFHISLTILSLVFIAIIAIYRRQLPKLAFKNIAAAILIFMLIVSSFIIAEYKFGHLSSFLKDSFGVGQFNLSIWLTNINFIMNRYINDNLIVVGEYSLWGLLITTVLALVILREKNRNKLLLLIIWFLTGFVPYFISTSRIYYYGIGGTVSLLILAGYLIHKLWIKNVILGLSLLMVILVSNLFLIIKNNKLHFNNYIVVEEGLVIPREKEALDYMYKEASGASFSVNAVMIPFNVKTTWDYLFNWYGLQRYGYTPVWGGDAAPGYEGVLKIETARSKLPKKRFLIIEPSKNIPSYMIDGLIKEEDNFSKVLEVKSFGNILVQSREGIN